MIHRHLDHPKGTPPAQLGAAAIDDLLDRGDLEDRAPLARAVAGEPWGPLSDTILRLCAAHPMYGMNQSEVSRRERRRDVRLSTLRGYVEAVGGWLRLVVTLPDSNRQVDLVVGGSGPRSGRNGADPDD